MTSPTADEQGCPGLFVRRTTIEISSAGHNPDFEGVGSSPYAGDMASTLLAIPEAFSDFGAVETRYLFRLAMLRVPLGGWARIKGLRQALTIGHLFELPDDGGLYPYDREVVSPFWCFRNGNVSWHLRKLAGNPTDPVPRQDPFQMPSTDTSIYGGNPGLLYTYDPGTAEYVALNNGMPPGDGIGSLGTFRDLRFPWTSQATATGMSDVHMGPCDIVFYASVMQTDTEGRQTLNFDSEDLRDSPLALRPEDQFLRLVPLAKYRGIAGSMIVEIGPVSPC